MAKKKIRKKIKKKTARHGNRHKSAVYTGPDKVAPDTAVPDAPAVAGKIGPGSSAGKRMPPVDAPRLLRPDGSKATYTEALNATIQPFSEPSFMINPSKWESIKGCIALLTRGCKILDAIVEEEEANARP